MRLKAKLLWQAAGLVAVSLGIIVLFYILVWKGNGGDWVVGFLETVLKMRPEAAHSLYTQLFRNNMLLIWMGGFLLVYFLLFYRFIRRITQYFSQVSRGIDRLLDDSREEIVLPPELAAVERRLNEVRRILEKRKLESRLEEQRKNDMVVYLAHDIRTPLTSVIGYLNLLDEIPEMPPSQRERYVHITLEKAQRLDKLINEFFEITRYNFQEILLEKETIDLCYMLVQMTDEFYPIVSQHGSVIRLEAEDSLTILGDPMKLARVFNNILKNAVAYSYKETEILVQAYQKEGEAVVVFQNKGKTIPKQKLDSIFEKFFRLDEARASDTGGAGLGLAIAKEIVDLHGGRIQASSEEGITRFEVYLPEKG